MRAVRIQGVRVEPSPYKKFDFDYDQGDIKTLFRRGEWRNWQQGIKWLSENGERDNELTPGETIAMVEDLRSLADAGTPFTTDPTQAFKLAHKNRVQNNKRFVKEHNDAIMIAKGQKSR